MILAFLILAAASADYWAVNPYPVNPYPLVGGDCVECIAGVRPNLPPQAEPYPHAPDPGEPPAQRR